MKIPHNKITFDQSEVRAVSDVVSSGYWVSGPVVEKTEKSLGTFFNIDHGVCVGSGLAALRLALLSLKISTGDEILIPAYSCVALANAVLSIGAVPVAIDSASNEFNMDTEKVSDAITSKTKAIIVVNSFGVGCDIKALKQFNLPVIEDCSHGFAVGESSTPQDFISDIVIFSFYATKLIAGSEGGAILSNNKNVIEFCRQYRDYTDQLPDANRLNDKMTDIEAALVGVQLEKLPEFLSMRYQAADRYDSLLSDGKIFLKPKFDNGRVWYRYCLSINTGNKLGDVIGKLEEKGVSVREPVDNWLGDDIDRYPNAKKAYETTLSLPLYPPITAEEQEYVCQTLMEVLEK